MKLLTITALLFFVSAESFAEDHQPLARYQIVSTSVGRQSVFRVNTLTGEVSYCFTITTDPGLNAVAEGVRCVPQVK